jgi:hypothetical protein
MRASPRERELAQELLTELGVPLHETGRVAGVLAGYREELLDPMAALAMRARGFELCTECCRWVEVHLLMHKGCKVCWRERALQATLPPEKGEP